VRVVSRRSLLLGLLLLAALPSAPARAQEWLDRLDQGLRLRSPGGAVQSELGVLFDLEGYYIDQRPPGLLFADGRATVNPRLTLLVDTRLGKHFYSLIQARVDRGFDPLLFGHEARLDEYLLRYIPFDDGRFNLQVGKFATVVGAWVPRHLSWENPFINAPLPYENVLTITDQAAPAGPAAFLARRNVPDRKRDWVPILWGPVYAAGASAFGTWKRFDYAVEVKNTATSARPPAWNPLEVGWDHPTVGLRLGCRPTSAWNTGVSYSRGAYLIPPAAATLPPGRSLADYRQTVLGYDVAYARRHWQVWGELFVSRFDVPNVGAADTWTYYVEAKYKVTPRFSAGFRWGEQGFGKVPDGTGGLERWDSRIWRAETSLGYRLTRHLQAKLQYGFLHEQRELQQGQQFVAAQLTVKF
jgi:hypothetical protein